MNWKEFVVSFLVCTLLVVVSHFFLDDRLAIHANELRSGDSRVAACTSDIPDVLLEVVCFITVSSWAIYFYFRLKNKDSIHKMFCRLTGTVIPLVFLLKVPLKLFFGRVNTRVWLIDPELCGFHWFQGGDDCNGFPSGHMVVFAALAYACWVFYPRYRFMYVSFLVLLGSALIVTDYHFLSDVIAGTYLGWVAGILTNQLLSRSNLPTTGDHQSTPLHF